MKKQRFNMTKKITVTALAAALLFTAAPALPAIAGNPANDSNAYAASGNFLTSNATALAKVTGLSTLTRDEDEVTLSWNIVDGASGYEIYRYTTTGDTWLLLGRTAGNTYEADDLISAGVYSFRVRAFAQNASGSIVYGDYSNTFKTCTSPDEVENLRASAKTTSTVTLKWSSVRRADKYQVYRYNSSTGTWKRLITTSKTTYKAKGLKSGTTYRFRVRALRQTLGYNYYGDFESLRVTTKKSGSTSSSSSGLISTSKAKRIALNYAGVSSSNATFTKVSQDYDDGIRIYEVEFYAGNYEYEFEIAAYGGRVLSYDKESIWD